MSNLLRYSNEGYHLITKTSKRISLQKYPIGSNGTWAIIDKTNDRLVFYKDEQQVWSKSGIIKGTVAFGPKGRFYTAEDLDGTLRVCERDTNSGEILDHYTVTAEFSDPSYKLAVSRDGHMFVGYSDSSNTYKALCLNPDFTPRWQFEAKRPNSSTAKQITAVCVDKDGNSYWGYDRSVEKRNSSGGQVWQHYSYDAFGGFSDTPRAMQFYEDKIYVVGHSTKRIKVLDISDGSVIRSNEPDTNGSFRDITIDLDGNIYAAEESTGIVKYDKDSLAATTFNSSPDARRLSADTKGDLYTGIIHGNYSVRKDTSDGTLLFAIETIGNNVEEFPASIEAHPGILTIFG